MNVTKIILLFSLLLWTTSCHEQGQRGVTKRVSVSGFDVAQLELKDSALLTHIKGAFYVSKSGQLFERTFAMRELPGSDTLVVVEYFNGTLPQDIDPLTFEQLDGWFAKDKQFAYYYKPLSGGMLCVKLDSADCNTFRVLPGQYLYAIDKTHVFKEADILENIDPGNMTITKDAKGEIVKIKSGETVYIAN